MTNGERSRYRRLQDRWLKNNGAAIGRYPKNTPILTGGPTIEQVERFVLPSWSAYFERTVDGIDEK